MVLPDELRQVAVGGWGQDGEVVVAQMRANVVCRGKTRRKESKYMQWVTIYSWGQLFSMYSSPYPSADFITGIASKTGTEESSDFIAEEQKGQVLRDAVVLQKRSRSRSYVQKWLGKRQGGVSEVGKTR